ncbi:MAG: hypothetical protein HUU09_10600 [Candidatus Jettenia caeni]|nr:hypothetical protein [Candidatus Jettenia caeni]
MKVPCKVFSIAMEYSVYEKLHAIAKENDTSVAKLLRDGANLILNKQRKEV